MESTRRGIFVSYSHKDAKWLTALREMLEPLRRNDMIDLWSDKRIAAGANWKAEIDRALEAAEIAILLVSPAFLASSFIMENELPPILQKARSHGLPVIWIAVSSSLFKQTDLVHFQAANNPSRPLDTLKPAAVNAELVKIGEVILKEIQKPKKDTESTEVIQQALEHNHPIGPLEFTISSVAEAAIVALGISRQAVLDSVQAEFKSHPILARIDYESIPRPLKSSLFVLLTKRGRIVCIEHIGTQFLPKESVELWSDLCQAYLRAFNLPFRTNHMVLIQESEFRRTMQTMKDLLEALHRYVFQARIYGDAKIYPNLHKLKGNADTNYGYAEFLYSKYLDASSNELIGKVALALDVIVSSAHKIAIEYRVRT